MFTDLDLFMSQVDTLAGITEKKREVFEWVIGFNSLAPGGFDYSLKLVNFKLIFTINILSIFCEIAIRWMPKHLTDH